ncbi:MAG TPA: hypothetical protein VEK56_10670 [Vicinamibacterales bacterium]|nr:hypothetical protein [Vicinamibacterales bacterium]
MVSRREVITGGVVGSLAGLPPAIEEQSADREGQREIQRAIQNVEGVLHRAFDTVSLSMGPIATLRRNFDQFIRANGKFPDFCDVGTSVFYDVYDWHVRNRQQIIVTRQESRYTIQFMFTTLLLRYENDANYVGFPYDNRA